MDQIKSFEDRLVSGGLIDTSLLKLNKRVRCLDPCRVPQWYRDVEHHVTSGGVLNTSMVYQVLLSSGLHHAVLASIWDLCSKTTPGLLVQQEFYQALAMVALCQAGQAPSFEALAALPTAPIPRLSLQQVPYNPSAAPPSDQHRSLAHLPPTAPTPLADSSNPSNGVSSHYQVSPSPQTWTPSSATMSPHMSSQSNGVQCIKDTSVQSWNGGMWNQLSSGDTSGQSVTSNGPYNSTNATNVPSLNEGYPPSGLQSTSSHERVHASNGYSPIILPHKAQHHFSNGNSVLTDFNNDISRTVEFDEQPLQSSSRPTGATYGKAGLWSETSNEVSIDNSSMDDDDFGDFSDFTSSTGIVQSPIPSKAAHINSISNEKAASFPTLSAASRINLNDPAMGQPLPEVIQGTHNLSRPSPPIIGTPSISSMFSVMTPQPVQPPSDEHPWLNFSLESATHQMESNHCSITSQEPSTPSSNHTSDHNRWTSRAPETSTVSIARSREIPVEPSTPKILESKEIMSSSVLSDDEFGDFGDFQSAPAESTFHEDVHQAADNNDELDEDRYAAFRDIFSSEDAQPLPHQILPPMGPSPPPSMESFDTVDGARVAPMSAGKDNILSLIRLPEIPKVEVTDDLSIFDCLAAGEDEENDESVLDQLHDLGLGYAAADGPVATESVGSSLQNSPTKSTASAESVGEPRGSRLMSLFSKNYFECASLSSFELGPNTESNSSSPTKGSILSLDLTPKLSPPDLDEGLWEEEPEGAPNTSEYNDVPGEVWAQPPTFPPPDPTIDLHSRPMYSDHSTPPQISSTEKVVDSWLLLVDKAAKMLESGALVLGQDTTILGEVLGTAKGQGYVSCLLEVYNVVMQVHKAATILFIAEVEERAKQVEKLWRQSKLEDISLRLNMNVLCLDHISSIPSTGEEQCGICLLPISSIPRSRLIFASQSYHSTCANLWANVLAKGLPSLSITSQQ